MDLQQQVSLAKAYELPFQLNDYQGSIDSISPIAVKLGSRPFLLSMPHSVVQKRENTLKEADDFTAAIGFLIQDKTDCHCICSKRTSDEDPNYVIGGNYKRKLRELIEQHSIGFVLDLHGASSSRLFDIDLGTMHGKTIDPDQVNLIKQAFFSHGIHDVRENDTFAAEHPGTITAYVYSELRIPCVQLEINSKYRKPYTDAQSFASLINSIIKITESISLQLEQQWEK
ncbi:hypothetical protein ELQ35_04365 [Peribacillus cavernae]|uniref:N-formylglutamate amidohydrolase n=1 Tax=Peribacillus cavernae TaxID=1674310 RepID=A0A433HTC5_9BACI|nr:N-formylglutamate amidohydrolase [Peribacillus cavernae]MDQ0218601.1 hypothetical protein [Peribacillus cavernae]RUQ31586.1 hypothetical protein ELQ35_04365 [Peribacillus cavernae]